MNKILLITDIFPPDIGGPASFIPDLARTLSEEGFQVTVFCRSESLTSPFDTLQPYRIVRTLRKTGRINALRAMSRLAVEVIRHDRVFCNGQEYLTHRVCHALNRSYILKVVGDLAWELARNAGLTDDSVDAFQSVTTKGTAARLVNNRLRFVHSARHIITPSHYLERLVLGWGYPSSQITVIPNGIRLEEFSSYHPRVRRGPPMELIFVGRLVNWKGVDHLLQAIEGVDDVHVSIVGDGPEYIRLHQYALEHSLLASFLGRCSREETIQHIACSDMLILPSGYEGFSHTLLEACASGVACIASSAGGNPEVIEDGVNGVLIPFGDVSALRAAIIHLRDNEQERLRLARAAKESSKKFDFTHTVRATASIITTRK